MKKVVSHLVFAVSFMFASMAHANIILTLDPGTQTTDVGDVVSVTVMVDGLGDFVPLSLSAFDMNIAFDTSALTFVSYNLFDGLSLDIFDSDDLSAGLVAPGILHIGEFSWLDAGELWDFQLGSFAIAELFFTVDDATTSEVSIVASQFWNAGGSAGPIIIDGINNASITGVAVPAPATSMLMCLGLLAMFFRQKYYSSGINKS